MEEPSSATTEIGSGLRGNWEEGGVVEGSWTVGVEVVGGFGVPEADNIVRRFSLSKTFTVLTTAAARRNM